MEEPFSTWAYGPVVYSVYDEFRSFSKDNIKRYARDARGDVFVIDETQDIELKVALDRVWDKAKGMGAVKLSEITHLQNSAWDKAFQDDEPVLKPADIATDNTYRVPLGLEAAEA
ncbi:DUF4065 domain-containing protein [Corynebacterium diphtheriae]|uniref:type II toxin-antitoxin system antitoxin SocA domain-containing protein n=1 Tax=Corynebacterium diphtheriae TaxID=1717 RepID=UPI00403E2777